MNDKYGVELQLITDKFKSNFNKIKDMMKEFGSEAKKNFTTGFYLDVDGTERELKVIEKKIRDSVEVSKKKIEELNNAKLDLSKLYAKRDSGLYKGVARGELESDIISKQAQINSLNSELQSSNQTVRNYTSAYRELNTDLDRTETKAGILGTAIGNLKRTFQDIGSYIKSGFGKDTEQQIENINNELDNMGKAGRNAGNGLSNMFTKGVKSLKRFALSLFGIQSIWRVLSRATSSYLQQNKELSNKIQSVWNALGTLVGPVVEFLANVFMKLLGYINVVTKALFGFDFIAKANTNTLKNYQKQANKTSKALAGIDELTNLNQQTSSDNDIGPALLEIPELDPKIVKFLEKVSKALKDNWDWLQWVLLGFGAVFGASAVAGWLGGIGKLLGATGGAGLLGLSGVLGWLATIGTIYIAIKLSYDYLFAEDMENLVKASGNNAVLDKKVSDREYKLNDYLEEQAKIFGKDSKQAKIYNGNLKDTLQHTTSLIGTNKENIGQLGLLEKGYLAITGGLDEYNEQQENFKTIVSNNEELLNDTIDKYISLYKQGLLNEDETEDYSKIMKLFGYNIDGTKLSTDQYKYALEKMGFSQEQVRAIVDRTAYGYELLSRNIEYATDDLTNIGRIAKGVTDKTYKIALDIQDIKNLPQELKNSTSYIEETLKKPFSIMFKTEVKSPTQQEIDNTANALKEMVTKGISNVFKVFGLKIPGFAVGTDLVKSDGLAYIHRGEQIVPADAVGGGWTGSNNNETNALLRELIETLDNKQFSASIGQDEVGRASVNYIRNQNRIMGGSVI